MPFDLRRMIASTDRAVVDRQAIAEARAAHRAVDRDREAIRRAHRDLRAARLTLDSDDAGVISLPHRGGKR